MKSKVFFSVAVILGCLLSTAFAAGVSVSEVNKDIDQGLDANFYQIKTKSLSLSPDDRKTLFELKKKSNLLYENARALNIAPGFGVGSFSQGDDYGGKIGLIGEAACLVTIWALTKTDNTKFEKDIQSVAVLSWIVVKIFEMYRPWAYTNDYNKKLEDALLLTTQIGPNENGSMALKFSTRF